MVPKRDSKVPADVAVEACADKVGLAVPAAAPLEAVLLAAEIGVAIAVVLESLGIYLYRYVVRIICVMWCWTYISNQGVADALTAPNVCSLKGARWLT